MAAVDYFTHPDHMRGATRQKQNVMMHKQLAHFEKCVKEVKGTYFSPTHNNMLRDLVPSNVIVTSLSVLRELVKREASRQHKKGIDICDSELVKHFDDFFQTIADLRRLKRDFTDKIYSVLFEFFYPLALNDVPEMLGKGGKRMSKVKNDNLSNIKSNSDPTDDEDDIEFEMPEELMDECNEMRDTIENIHHTNYRWEKLMASDEIDANFFDPDTLRELRLYDSSKNFEYMLRVVPDIINKSLRAVDLARKWWFNSDKLCKKLKQFKQEMELMPRRRRSLVMIAESENSERSDTEEIDNEIPDPPRIEVQQFDPIDNNLQKAADRVKRPKKEAARYQDEKQKQAAAKYLDEKQKEAMKYPEEKHKEANIKYRHKRQKDEQATMYRNDRREVADVSDRERHTEVETMRYPVKSSDDVEDRSHRDKSYKDVKTKERYRDVAEKYPDKRSKRVPVVKYQIEQQETTDASDDDFRQKTKVVPNVRKDRHQTVVATESSDDNDDDNDGSELIENSYEDENLSNHSDQEIKTVVDSAAVLKSKQDQIIDESYKSIVHLLEDLKQVIAKIGTLEKELIRQKKELNGLTKRHNRLDDLSSDVEKAKDTKDNVYVKLKELEKTKAELVNKISRSKSGSLLHTELKKTLASTEEDIMELKNAVKLHEFHHELLTSDLDVEMEMRPTLTGYSRRLQSKIRELERNLAIETERRHALEKQLIVAKANLQQTMNEDPPTEQNKHPKSPAKQMYVYQSGIKNPPLGKPPNSESNNSEIDQRNLQSPAIKTKQKKRSKKKPPVSVALNVDPTLPQLIPNGHTSQIHSDSKRRSHKSQKPDVYFDSRTPLTSQYIDDVPSQLNDTNNADVISRQRSQSILERNKKPKTKKADHNVLFTPQNGGRYRKSPGNQEPAYGSDRRISSSDDGASDFKQGLSDYSVKGSTRKEHESILNTTYRVQQPERKKVQQKQMQGLLKVTDKHRKPRKDKKQIQYDESDEETYRPNDQTRKPINRGEYHPVKHRNKQLDTTGYLPNRKQTLYQQDDALSIPDDPDAGSSESNDSDFSEELKAKQKKLRQLRHLEEAKHKRTSYDRPQRKPDKHPQLYDSKRDQSNFGHPHFDVTPPPPPGYKDKRSKIPVKIY